MESFDCRLSRLVVVLSRISDNVEALGEDSGSAIAGVFSTVDTQPVNFDRGGSILKVAIAEAVQDLSMPVHAFCKMRPLEDGLSPDDRSRVLVKILVCNRR